MIAAVYSSIPQGIEGAAVVAVAALEKGSE